MTVYIVSSGGDVDQVFATCEDAERFASENPADVEWFHDTTDSRWHIAGFGIDKAALDAMVQSAVDRVRRLGHGATTEAARGAAS